MKIKQDILELWSEKLKAISHPERLAILKLLCKTAQKQMTVAAIYSALDLSQPTVSKHLAIMKRAGICQRKAVGVKTYYTLSDKTITRLIKSIDHD